MCEGAIEGGPGRGLPLQGEGGGGGGDCLEESGGAGSILCSSKKKRQGKLEEHQHAEYMPVTMSLAVPTQGLNTCS